MSGPAYKTAQAVEQAWSDASDNTCDGARSYGPDSSKELRALTRPPSEAGSFSADQEVRRQRARFRGTDTSPSPSQLEGYNVTESDVLQTVIEPTTIHVKQLRTEQTLQEWEGRVVGLQDDVITAALIDITAGHTRDSESIELPISDFSDDDLKIIRVGSIFRLLIGYEFTRGSKKRVTRLVLRRLPMWTASEIARAESEAKDLVEKIAWS